MHAQNKLRQWNKPEGFDPATAVAAKPDFAVQQTAYKNVPNPDAEATSTVSVSAPSSNWIRKTDPKSGRIYYANLLTKKTQWKACSFLHAFFSSCFFVSCVALCGRLDGFMCQVPAQGWKHDDFETESKTTDTATVSTSSSNWIRKRDPKSGRIFYANVLTKKTQWKACFCFRAFSSPSTVIHDWMCFVDCVRSLSKAETTRSGIASPLSIT